MWCKFLILLVLATGVARAEDQILTLSLENDMFASGGTDEYYTHGTRLSYLNAQKQTPLWAEKVIDVLPMMEKGPLTGYSLSLGQNIYTPEKIAVAGEQYGDRPWAGYSYLSMAVASGDLDKVDDVELSVGVVGPAALAEQSQKIIHRWVGAQRPQGWGNQLDNEPALNIAWQRRFPRWWDLPLGPTLLSFTPHVSGAAGNVYTHAAVGGTFRWSTDAGFLADNPVRVRPALPGTGYFARSDKPNLILFAGGEERLVARNIFLDGNTFGDSPNVRKRNLVTDLQAGAMVAYKNYQVGYTAVRRSREFYGQDGAQIFGALTFGWRF